jgi:hypothetical protein
MKPFALSLLLLTTACGARLPLVGAPCPCAAGTVCDVESDTCVLATDGSVVDGPSLAPDASAPDVASTTDDPCHAVGLNGIDEVERLFIAPRCGTALCHSAASVFPPKNLDKPESIRSALLGQMGRLSCKTDFYVDPTNPAKSYLLATIEPVTNQVTCPSGQRGGTRMPNAFGMPGAEGPPLSETEIACLRWWVFEIAKP